MKVMAGKPATKEGKSPYIIHYRSCFLWNTGFRRPRSKPRFQGKGTGRRSWWKKLPDRRRNECRREDLPSARVSMFRGGKDG